MLQRVARLSVLCAAWACLAAASDPPGIWIDVPFVRQQKNACGAAALSMVMRYWGANEPLPAPRSDPQRIQQALYSDEARGIPAAAMERYLQESGFRTFSFAGEWADLGQHLSQGRPLIVCLKPGGQNTLHYVVVTGLDWQRDLVFVNDPAKGKLKRLARSDFEKSWSSSGNWTLLAVPRQTG